MNKLRSFWELITLIRRSIKVALLEWRNQKKQQAEQEKWVEEFDPFVRSVRTSVVEMLGGGVKERLLTDSFRDALLLADVSSRLIPTLGATGLFQRLQQIAGLAEPDQELLRIQTDLTLPGGSQAIGPGTWQIDYRGRAEWSV